MTITATNYAPERFAALESTIAEKGLKLTGYSGEAKDFGADVKYNYDAATETLTVEVLHGPHFHDFTAFCAELQTFIENQKAPEPAGAAEPIAGGPQRVAEPVSDVTIQEVAPQGVAQSVVNEPPRKTVANPTGH
jgi:hypothetical protein